VKTDVFKVILNHLEELGIKKGDHLLVHSSLRSLGQIPEKAFTVTQALLNAVGKTGNLLMPALSHRIVTPTNPYFHIINTPSCVGGLTEFFRQYPGAMRSMHPTHSVCCYGPDSHFFIDNHTFDSTPVGKNSPFRKLFEANGKILFLGCSTRVNTSMHGVEELSEPEYLFAPAIEYTLETDEGAMLKKSYRPHNFKGFVQRFDRILNLLSTEEFTFGKVLSAECCVLQSSAVWEKGHRTLLTDPLYFVDRKSTLE